jgi:hypothetical protein
MPCYLFTFHAHGSWLPDHPRGYVRRGRGIQPQNHRMAALYGENLKSRVAVFDDAIQRVLIAAAQEACQRQTCRCHFIATDPTHMHVLASWSSERTWELVRMQIGSKASRSLNATFSRRTWFAKSPSRKRLKDRGHFDYLMTTYLPRHAGWKWNEKRGEFR